MDKEHQLLHVAVTQEIPRSLPTDQNWAQLSVWTFMLCGFSRVTYAKLQKNPSCWEWLLTTSAAGTRLPASHATVLVQKSPRWGFSMQADRGSAPSADGYSEAAGWAEQRELKLCTSTSQRRRGEHRTFTRIFKSVALESALGESPSTKGSPFHVIRFCTFRVAALTSCTGGPSLGCNSAILKLFKLFIQMKSWS